jgi:hypothetical protein
MLKAIMALVGGGAGLAGLFGGAGGAGAGQPLDPKLQAYLMDLMGMGTDRIRRTEPIHQAAMAMATRMAPDYAQAAMTAPRAPMDPSMLAQAASSLVK